MPVDYLETYSSQNFVVRDATGQPVDAGTVNIDITKPDGTAVTTFAAAHPALGTYNFDYLTTASGRHPFFVTATGGALGSLVRKWFDVFVVRPQNPATAVELREAKAHLNEQGNLQDEEIRAYLEVATEIVEGILGEPLSIRTYTERVRNGTWVFKLRNTPVVSVTSVTSIRVPSTVYLTAQLDVDQDYGIVYLKTGTDFTNGPWTVIYQAGNVALPARYTQAVLDLLWHMWVFQRGQLADTTAPDLVDVTDFETRGSFISGFLVPHYVREKLETDTVPGVA